ncbi:glycosyltransferase family 39 protein [Dyella mobilis]|uniref:Glycosyltransferase family 39 protein n=1 Tax=Dyella mobilis TaxID=1849582 RepID=A0ABS2KK67_9GAMM|nr:glycosyltransferase family 39 protein [Dyella mobilis]MBM7131474.1 glycosyltransferase family 39 protein [Dyella mobilis]GLQ96552.1 hypothetical protein GCM10007863_09700 [Dyella mobilis]
MNTRPSVEHRTQDRRITWPGALYALIALSGCVFAFIGLSNNSFWADELFTLQLIDHHDGLAGVFRRMLSDVHPPLYDFLLYGWVQLAGTGEVAVRLPSALLAVAAIGLFVACTRRRLTPAAIAFACAAATTSMYWFVQAQNARDYALCEVLSVALLATAIGLRRRSRSSAGFPWGYWAGLTLLGVAGSQTHAYMLLTVGMLLFYLILTARSWPLRIALIGSGLLILGLYVGLLWPMAHAGYSHDFSGSWFNNKPKFFLSQLHRTLFNLINRQCAIVIAAMLLGLWLHHSRRTQVPVERTDDSIRWITGLSWFVLLGVIVGGIAVSVLVTPSFSYRNVLVCAPFGWFLIGRAYDVAGPRTETRLGQWLALAAIVLVGSQLFVLIRGRLLPTNEPWRASAAYVRGLSSCSQATLPVVASPEDYGGTLLPVVRETLQRNYYGYYLPNTYRLHAYAPDELLQQFAQTLRDGQTSATACPLVAWALHGIDDEDRALQFAEQLASTPGLPSRRIAVQEFVAYELHLLSWKPQPSAFVFMQVSGEKWAAPATLADGMEIDKTHSIGDLLLVTDVTPATDATMHSYTIQRWHDGKMAGQTTVTRQPSASSR